MVGYYEFRIPGTNVIATRVPRTAYEIQFRIGDDYSPVYNMQRSPEREVRENFLRWLVERGYVSDEPYQWEYFISRLPNWRS